jgi:hypothetical protein
MQKIWETDNRQLTLAVSIKCAGTCRFRVIAQDLKPFSTYVDREIEVEGYRTIELKLPVTPKKMRIDVVILGASSTDFLVGIEEKPLVTYNIYLDNEVKEFLNLCVPFCQTAGWQQASPGGRIYTKGDETFKIKFFPVIKDYMSGVVLNTPARIGHRTGIIEVSQDSFKKYTFAMRMIIMLHEFSHKYRNQKIGLPISHESGADVNALYIYLGLGFSKVDAIYVFANVFLKAQTDGNIRRMRKIMDYITKFENEEFAHKN